MAFGDLVTKDRSNFATTQTGDIGGNPTSGNLLILAGGTQSLSATLTTAPTGFTQIGLQEGGTSGNLTCGAWYKISDGTEQTATVVWSAGLGYAEYLEYDLDSTTIDGFQVNDDKTNISSASTTQDAGSITPAESTNLCVFGAFADQSSNCDGGAAWSLSATVDHIMENIGGAAGSVAHLIDQSGATNPQFSTTDTGDEMWGWHLVAYYGGGSTIYVVPQTQRNVRHSGRFL